jgi:hypothetical protein
LKGRHFGSPVPWQRASGKRTISRFRTRREFNTSVTQADYTLHGEELFSGESDYGGELIPGLGDLHERQNELPTSTGKR